MVYGHAVRVDQRIPKEGVNCFGCDLPWAEVVCSRLYVVLDEILEARTDPVQASYLFFHILTLEHELGVTPRGG